MENFNNSIAPTSLPRTDSSVVLLVIRHEVGSAVVDAKERLQTALARLPVGGWLCLYGEPADLPGWAELLRREETLAKQVLFKYWIALDLHDRARTGFLQPTHQGLILFTKRDPARRTPPPFRLYPNAARVPHRTCAACGENVKDWGGKKHLLNPLGAAPSDVWRDLPRRKLSKTEVPAEVGERIARLAGVSLEDIQLMLTPETKAGKTSEKARVPLIELASSRSRDFAELKQIEPDRIYEGDCLALLSRTAVLYPNGRFDLAFADPPYNLEKRYGRWDDALAEEKYLAWCESWLGGMAATLKPGGSLLVLNLPKWATHHAAFLQRFLDFRHWIVWDALSDPRGKLMPAHYALLWFTKPGGKPVCNYAPLGQAATVGQVTPPDAPRYCLRAKCICQRKTRGDDAKVELSDIWFDVHRIRHKRDRDAHPCQLPEKLMERIIKLASRPGDLVYDPFGGAGTTAIAALKLGRQFVLSELDRDYVRIANQKLAALRKHADLFGEFNVPRPSTTRLRSDLTKKEVESYLQQLAQRLERLPTEADVLADRPGLLTEIDRMYPNRGAAFKRAKVGLAAHLLPR